MTVFSDCENKVAMMKNKVRCPGQKSNHQEKKILRMRNRRHMQLNNDPGAN
jgi:hypothetical protein